MGSSAKVRNVLTIRVTTSFQRTLLHVVSQSVSQSHNTEMLLTTAVTYSRFSPPTSLALIYFCSAVVLAPMQHSAENYAQISRTQTWVPPVLDEAALGGYDSGTQAQSWVSCNRKVTNCIHHLRLTYPVPP